eukprot:4153603-Amphidinium_carterae.1
MAHDMLFLHEFVRNNVMLILTKWFTYFVFASSYNVELHCYSFTKLVRASASGRRSEESIQVRPGGHYDAVLSVSFVSQFQFPWLQLISVYYGKVRADAIRADPVVEGLG